MISLRPGFLVVSCLVLFAVSPPAFATKTCPGSPCDQGNRIFNADRCMALADWVAEGTIGNIEHDVQGSPLNKDFAAFDFVITRWIKDYRKDTKKFRFKVGWCHNPLPLPEDTSGKFRFYGGRISPERKYDPQYLWFEKVK